MDQPEYISLLALLHTPEMFDGHPVQVVGLCSFLGDSSAMWAAAEYYNSSITRNAIGLALQPSDELAAWHGKVMLVEGVFSNDPELQTGPYSGTLTKVSRIEGWSV